MSDRRRKRAHLAAWVAGVLIDRGADGLAAIHRSIATEPGAPGQPERRRVRCECKLDWLRVQRHISERQWSAGERYRTLYLGQQERGPNNMPLDGQISAVQGGHALVGPEASCGRFQALRAAHSALTPIQRLVVQTVAGEDQACAGRIRHLVSGLETLADYWRMER